MHQSPLHIAVVEDEDSVRRALTRLLRSAGFSADVYASGEDFFQALPQRMPDCLLLDLKLPGMDGLAVHSQLRTAGVRLPVVFITATDCSEAREQAMRSGECDGWLRKPVDEQPLLKTIAQALFGKNDSPKT